MTVSFPLSALIQDNNIGDAGMRALSLVLIPTFINQSLRAFSCASNPLSFDGARAICTIILNNPQIQRLWLRGRSFLA